MLDAPAPPAEHDQFAGRHIGPREDEIRAMVAALGYASLDTFIDAVIPQTIRARRPLALGPGQSEAEALAELTRIAGRNEVYRSFLGQGYVGCIVPPVIRRNVLENPSWYTAYTPYQPEIAQGRLEALLTFQTVVIDLTGLPVANASLLDEATAAAEAMSLAFSARGDGERDTFFVSESCHPQTIEVVATRARARGIRVVVGDHRSGLPERCFGALVQYPATDGCVHDYREFRAETERAGAILAVAADLLSLTVLTPPGEWGADIVVGSSQRFGVPMGFGGPHAAFFATREEFKRLVPGRIIGVSRDADGKPALRMALQMREQHIKREKATSNVCTAQVLLAVMAGMYAVWHGPDGLTRIARRVHGLAEALAEGARRLGLSVEHDVFFDTVRVALHGRSVAAVTAAAEARKINLRVFEDGSVAATLDEETTAADVDDILAVLNGGPAAPVAAELLLAAVDARYDERFARVSPFLTHPVFSRYRSEAEMTRYLHRLETRDLSLTTSMIPLGSCTMKLNATAEMLPISFPGFADLHPYAPAAQTAGYAEMTARLSRALAEITGFDAVSLQPNAGSQGELAGLLAIRGLHAARGEASRDVCLIPQSAHGTNAASAVMAGLRVVAVATDARGNVDLEDLEAKAREHGAAVAALIVTYPSTHGVFEVRIKDICRIVHDAGGRVYMDGANMNAMVGLARPAEIGADVCHLNLHKTFCIPHGGGGPGVGPIAVTRELAPFLPEQIGAVSAAPFGSAGILPISFAYIEMMGAAGLTKATKVAILNANYVARRLADAYPLLYSGVNGLVAHECIVDTRPFKASAGIEVEDIAKRLMDYGFHAPTVSFPVAGTLMIEPTESESQSELDRFCDAMLAIREEIREIEAGRADRKNNVLKRAPHTAAEVVADQWDRPYSRERAAYPAPWTREHKFWPAVARIEGAYGDRNLVCSCQVVPEPVDD
jgi:glycine cleavage system P protein (glycine dehydrogenase)